MEEDTHNLNEVVVVGFGTQKKVNLTGSVSVVNAKELASRPVTNVTQTLQGLVPGMNFSYANTGNGGELGQDMNINIRGSRYNRQRLQLVAPGFNRRHGRRYERA